jgi:hypothetical protein
MSPIRANESATESPITVDFSHGSQWVASVKTAATAVAGPSGCGEDVADGELEGDVEAAGNDDMGG